MEMQGIIGTWPKLQWHHRNLSKYETVPMDFVLLNRLFGDFYDLNTTIFFQIVFEGIVGKNSLGNIAIDDISVAPGVCPSKCFVNIVICKFTLGRKIFKTSRPKN